MSPSSRTQRRAEAGAPRSAGFEFTCRSCGNALQAEQLGEVQRCPKCKEKLGAVAQLEQLLERWYEPRRWRADLVRPSARLLVEQLWTADGQGERLYAGVSPKHTNYDIFRSLVTRLIVHGIDEGWVELTFPSDPLTEDPRYALRIVDSEKFASGVERLFQGEVDWDEPVEVPPATEPAPTSADTGKRGRTKSARPRPN